MKRPAKGRPFIRLPLLALLALGGPWPACTTESGVTADVPGLPEEEEQERPWMGEVLFTESFDDTELAARGWYDALPPRITTAMHAPGSSAAFECRFDAGATGCADGTPGRHRFEGVEELYVRFQVRYSDGWVGSGKPYHPHELYLLTSEDDRFAGPAYTHLTLYIEQVDLRGRVGLQDGRNVDARCVLGNDDRPIGCDGGAFAAFPFNENRSVAACNGLVGPVQFRDCYSLGDERWYSSRAWQADAAVLGATGGTDGWHLVETYIRLNSIRDGVGVADGAIHYAVDGTPVLALDSLLLRTAQHPDMRIDQLLIAPYIGDGSPVAQMLWLDELIVARGRRP